MEQKNTQHSIDLRSEKTRQIIGDIPHFLLSYGIIIITTAICFFIILVYFLPYQENIICKASISKINNSSYEISIMIPYDKITQIEQGMPVQVHMEGYNTREYGSLNGSISNIDKMVRPISNKNYFKVEVIIPIGVKDIEVHLNMKGDASILITHGSLLHSLFARQ